MKRSSKINEIFPDHQGNKEAKKFSDLSSKAAGKKSKLLFDHKSQRGQSFVELSLVVIFLMIFVAGIVEFGFMLNNYLNLVDASREAVRYSADGDPFDESGNLDTGFFVVTGQLTQEILAPLVLDPSVGDDIIISFFSVADGYYQRYPNAAGWSVMGTQTTKLSDAEIQSRLDNSAPPTGVLLVEIYYNYSQVLKLPVFTMFVRDPIPVHAYAIMPLTAAEPIVTGGAGGGGGGGTLLPTFTLIPTNSPVPSPTFTHTFTPTNTPVNTPTASRTPTSTFTPTKTATPTLTFTPSATATASNTPSPTATSFVCNVKGSNFILDKKSLIVEITNNTSQTLHYANIMLFFNPDTPKDQELKKIKNDGNTLWDAKTSSSPFSGSLGGEVGPSSTIQLEFEFKKDYEITGVEHLLLEFVEKGCQPLNIQ